MLRLWSFWKLFDQVSVEIYDYRHRIYAVPVVFLHDFDTSVSPRLKELENDTAVLEKVTGTVALVKPSALL